jgi:hypothetical protein
MRNTLTDLNNHLFAQLERLGDEDLKGEVLKEEIERAKAVTSVAKNIIENGTLILDAHKFRDNSLNIETKLPKLLEGGDA